MNQPGLGVSLCIRKRVKEGERDKKRVRIRREKET